MYFDYAQYKQKGFAHLLILLVLALALGSIFYFGQQTLRNFTSPTQTASLAVPQAEADNKLPIPSPTERPVLWKTYHNTKYGFELAYPVRGVIHMDEQYQEGECGDKIKEKAQQTGRIIQTYVAETTRVDNFFEIVVLDWNGTIEQYLGAIGAKEQYELNFFSGSLAEEAVEVVGLKKGAEYAVGYPPLAYVSHIFRKGPHLFLVKNLLTHDDVGGCINPAVLDPVKYEKFVNQKWDLKASFKFN